MAQGDSLELRALADVLRTSGDTYRRDGDFARAAEFLRKSLEILERLAEPGPVAGGRLELARVLVRTGDVDEAAELAGSAREALEAAEDRSGLAGCHELLGGIARGRGRKGEAEEHYGRALELWRELGDDRGLAGTLAQYGLLHNERGDYEAAEERYRAALAIFERVGDREQVAALTNNLGTLALRRGDPAAAAAELERARELFDEIGDRLGVGKCLNNLAGIYRALGQDGKSADSFRRGLALFEEIGDKRGAAIAANNLAVIEQDLGRWREAEELHEKSLRLKRDMGDRPGEAVSIGNLGDIAFFRGDWEKAGRLYREALAVQEAAGNRAGCAWVHNHAARLALARGQRDRASREAATARAIGREVGSREIQAEALVTEIRLALDSGDLAGARKLLDEAGEHARGMRSREVEAVVRRAGGEVLAAEGKANEADDVFDEVERAFRRLRRPFDRAGVEIARGLAWARSGRGDRAVEPFASAERRLEELGAAVHVLAPLKAAVESLARDHPGEGPELAEAGLRLALRLGAEDVAGELSRLRDEIARGRERERTPELRLADVGRLAEALLKLPDPEEVPAFVLGRLVVELRADRGILLVRASSDDPFDVVASPGFEDPARTDAVRAAERVAETGEVLRDFRGGDRSAPRSRLVLGFGGAESATAVLHLETSPGTRGFAGDDERFAFAVLGALALRLAGGSEVAGAVVRPRGKRRERDAAFAEIVGDSGRMDDVLETSRRVARGNATVLLLGESGTGKELLARGIHRASPRAEERFVAVNCPSIPRDLLESELFGYEKGAFTGADQPKEGRLELANGGTLFLDEVGDLPLPAQAKLLRVLQERTFERLGGLETKRVDVRVLAATSVDLARAVAERRFREDLYYRLNVVPVVLPPLRERPEDVPALVDHFLAKYQPDDRPVRGVSPEALRLLGAYPWPGNIRELENAVQYAVNLMDGDTLRPGDLPRAVRSWAPEGGPAAGSLQSEMDRLERDLILRALEATGWNRSEAARRLGTNESKIRQRMKKHGISPPRKPRTGRRMSRRMGDFGNPRES
jgi:DNA-binding NtrC family response regulator/tetratricopeptide (TPR) repeat protein